MEAFNYFLTLIVSFLGLFAGILIAYLTKEEYKELEKSMKLAAFGLIVGMTISIFMFYHIVLWISLPLVIIIALIVQYVKIPDYIMFILLGVVFYISSFYEALLMINSFLIFTYGILATTFKVNAKKEKWFRLTGKIFLRFVPYIIVGGILFFI